MVIIGRYINGVYLNGIEWVLEGDEEDSDVMKFKSKEAAKKFLLNSGFDEEEIKGMIFYDVEG